MPELMENHMPRVGIGRIVMLLTIAAALNNISCVSNKVQKLPDGEKVVTSLPPVIEKYGAKPHVYAYPLIKFGNDEFGIGVDSHGNWYLGESRNSILLK